MKRFHYTFDIKHVRVEVDADTDAEAHDIVNEMNVVARVCEHDIELVDVEENAPDHSNN